MKWTLDEEQLGIKDSAKHFFREHCPVSALRGMRDRRTARRFDPQVWRRMAEIGFSAITVAPEHGGLGLGYGTLGAVLEEAGRTLAATPLFSSLVLGASAVELCGTPSQKSSLLRALVEGRRTFALALEDGHQHPSSDGPCFADKVSEGYVLRGRKRIVFDGSLADQVLVLARTSRSPECLDGLTFFLVDGDRLERSAVEMIDSRDAAVVALDGVRVGAQAVLGEEGAATRALPRILERAAACLAAEMLGGTIELFERTLAYLREREQFGVKIATFQALRHRAARLYIELELTRSVVAAALAALDEPSADTPSLVNLAKHRANDGYRLVSNEAIQMHGGVGVTDELEIGLFLKRSRVAIQSFGDSTFHRDQFAAGQGY